MNALLTAEGLRAHLHDLVIRWFGALPAPTDEEWVLAHRMLIDPTRRGRLMAAMGANPGWFAYLKDSTIPGLLAQDDETINSLVIPYLISMLGTAAQAEVVNMVSPYLGRSERWDHRLTWMLQSIREWKTPEAVDLFERAFVALSPDDITHLYQMDDVAKADPRAGCWLARVAFDKVLEGYLAAKEAGKATYFFSFRAFLEQYNGSTMDETLKTVARNEPEYFLEQMLPWLERIIELSAEPDDTLPYYRSDEFSYLGWYGDGFVVKHQLIEAYIAALSELAQTDEQQFRRVAERLAASTRATPQRILAHVYRALRETYADDACRFLTGDRRRLELGDHDQYDTRQLLKAIYPHLCESSRAELESFILSHIYIMKYSGVRGLRWRGIEQLRLLQSVPRELLTERGERALRELQRKFPGERASDSPTTIRAGRVGPPVSEAQARKMSDRSWLRAMKKYHGDVRHKDFLKGGARELGGVLVNLTKEDPERFYGLVLRLPDDVDDSYVQAIMNGLAESNASSDLLIAVIRRFAPHPDRDIKRVIGSVLEKRAGDVLPEDMMALVEGYVRGPAGEDEDWWRRQDERGQARRNDGLNSGPYMSYLNSNRGAAFRALMRALDAKGDDEAKARKWQMIEFAATDDSTALRAGAIEELLYLLHEDRERAVTTFERLLDGHPALLRSHFTQEFLRYGLYRHFESMRPYIVALMNGEHESLQQRGAELACIAAISPAPSGAEEGRGDADALAEGTLTGPPPWRRGAAHVYAANITTEVSASCENVLRRLMGDEDKEVRQFVNGVFHRLRDEHFLQLRDLIEAFAASRSLSEETHWFTDFLWEHGILDPPFSLSVVESLLGNERRKVEEPAFRITGGEEIVRLVLRIYTDPSSADLRGLAMDVFDRLMDIFAGQAQIVLGEWDRR
ncbi:MAG: hypothetical protein ACJ741_03525 [Pyrinomonadaceae bacterium]